MSYLLFWTAMCLLLPFLLFSRVDPLLVTTRQPLLSQVHALRICSLPSYARFAKKCVGCRPPYWGRIN
jgi:hypothetical protein